MKNVGMYVCSMVIGVASAWIATTMLISPPPTPEPVTTVIEAPEVVHEFAVVEDVSEGLDEITLRTGDTFWGLHFDGMLPCSKMIVRGGGHIVNFSLLDDPLRHSHFHVRGAREILVYDRPITVEVLGDDEIRVSRTPTGSVAASVGD